MMQLLGSRTQNNDAGDSSIPKPAENASMAQGSRNAGGFDDNFQDDIPW